MTMPSGASFNVRMIDCVGYIVPGALGLYEDETPRMVMTPWSESPMPFEEAAEIGTRKVMSEHSTVGIIITADGSFTELDRDGYAEAEDRVIGEMKATGKPFTVILNCLEPQSESADSIKRAV